MTNKSVLHLLSLSIKIIIDYYCVFELNKLNVSKLNTFFLKCKMKFTMLTMSSLNPILEKKTSFSPDRGKRRPYEIRNQFLKSGINVFDVLAYGKIGKTK